MLGKAKARLAPAAQTRRPRGRRLIAAIIAFALTGDVPAKSGFFHVGWKNGIAQFIAPTGGTLWSLGVDCVGTGTDRKDYKPSNKSYAAYREFTSDAEWVHDTIGRLKSWSFNSTGGWSDDDLFRKYGGKSRLPYFVVLHLGAYDQAPWHDLFDKQMEHWVTFAAKKQIPPIANDPMLVGYFTDNELGWWDDTLFMSYLKMKPDAPGRKRLIQALRTFYRGNFNSGTLRGYNSLTEDWIVTGSSFERITAMHLRPGGQGRWAVDYWTQVLATRYYSLVRDTIRRFDKNHLILGDRYCQYYTLPVVRAAANYVDVISTNFGADWNDGSIAPFFLRTLNRETQKPVIVTEFYMCSRENRSGNANAGTVFPVVDTQQERAQAFARYVTSVAALPYTVGAHWFQFYDEPQHGRGDGENYNMGLVDTEGRAYKQLTTAAASINLPAIRRHSTDPLLGVSCLPALMPVPQLAQVPQRTLKGWPLGSGELPRLTDPAFGDTFVVRDAGFLYLGLYAMDYMDESLYVGGRVPEIDRNRWQIQLTGMPTIDIRYGGKSRKASINVPGIGVQEVAGLKYTVILKIPIKRFHDRVVRCDCRVDTHGRSSTMVLGGDLELEPAK